MTRHPICSKQSCFRRTSSTPKTRFTIKQIRSTSTCRRMPWWTWRAADSRNTTRGGRRCFPLAPGSGWNGWWCRCSALSPFSSCSLTSADGSETSSLGRRGVSSRFARSSSSASPITDRTPRPWHSFLAHFFSTTTRSDDREAERSRWRLLSVGLLLGYCSLIRYLDWIPLMTWIAFDLLRQRKIKGLILRLARLRPAWHPVTSFTIGFYWERVPAALRLCRESKSERESRRFLDGIRDHCDPTRTSAVCFSAGRFVSAGLIQRCQSARLKTYLALFALTVVHLLFYPWGVAGPGPRYFFPVLSVSHPCGDRGLSVDPRPENRQNWVVRGHVLPRRLQFRVWSRSGLRDL